MLHISIQCAIRAKISDNSHYVRYSVQPTYVSDVHNSSSDLDDVMDTDYK